MEWIIASVQVGALFIGAGAVVVAFNGVRDQLWLQTFTEYTKRYSDIMEGLPFEARRPGGEFDVEALNESARDEYLRTMRNYLNLCSEELHLHNKGRIDRETWEIWKTGIEQVAQFPCFGYAWQRLRPEYESYADFCAFMDELLSRASATSP